MFGSVKRKAFWPVLMWKGNVRVFDNFVRLVELSLWQIEKLFYFCFKLWLCGRKVALI